jgi:hypothetical protein
MMGCNLGVKKYPGFFVTFLVAGCSILEMAHTALVMKKNKYDFN